MKTIKIRNYLVFLLIISLQVGCTTTSPGKSRGIADKAVNSKYASYQDQFPNKKVYRVWYGTDRKPLEPSDLSKGFSNVRDDTLHYGTCIVQVPKAHKFGSIGSSWIRRYFVIGADDRLKLERIDGLTSQHFQESLRETLLTRPRGSREALVFIHGFNVTFEEAVIRAAQIGYDLGIEGITALYSWPSKGKVTKYTVDEATIGASEFHLQEFLEKVFTNPGVEEVNIIAHSMGNRALLRAMERISKKHKKPFNQILLAAPDIDTITFKNLAAVYEDSARRTTLYVSSKDLALKSSGIIHDFPRAGFTPPILTIPGIDTVDVSNIDLTLMGHGYVAEAEAVLYDMHELIQSNTPPEERIRIKQILVTNEGHFWQIRK